jgi:signal transduction histidine kinase/riboflavin transporter FmnP
VSGGDSPLTAPADAGSRHPLEAPAGTHAAPASDAIGATGVEPGAERLVRIVAGAIGVSAVIFGALSYDSFRTQAYENTFWLSLTFWLLGFGLPTAFGLLSRWASMRVLRAIALTQGVVFILLLVSWLLFRMHPLPAGADIPWAVTFTGLPTVSVAIVVRTRLAWAYTIVACVLSGLVRAETSAEPNPLLIGFEDGLYSLLLMSVFVGLALAARRGAIQVSHAAALDRAAASESAARVARKQERLLIDALVHDSVISTLLSAGGGRADSRELARHAAHTLSQVDTLRRPSTGRVVTSGELERRLRQLAADIATDADFDTRLDADGTIPSEVAAAFVGAVQEALRNSVTYAGQDGRVVSRSVTVRYLDGLHVEVRDDGAGFEPAEVRAERLGITRSILGRVNSLAGCCASVVSHPGAGTEVFLHWNGESAADSAAHDTPSPEAGATPSAIGARSVPQGAAPAVVPLTGMFGLSTPIARLILGLFVVVHAVLAFSDHESGFVLELGAFLGITAAAVWVTRAATDPLPRGRAVGILALLAVSEVMMCLQVPVVGASPFANWHLGAITLLLLILAVRGRPGWAWAGYAGLFSASVTWAVLSGLPAGTGVDLVIRHAGTLLAGTLFAVGLRGSLNALAALNNQLSRTETAEATEIAAIEERQAQLARLNVIARPALERLAEPHDLSDAERADCRLVEASLRDAIRARALFVEPVTSAARAARVRGVDVTLLDDSGDQPPVDIDRVARIVADQLDSAASGRLIARVLPADRPVLATIVVEGAEHRMLAVTPAGDLRDA